MGELDEGRHNDVYYEYVRKGVGENRFRGRRGEGKKEELM